MAPTLPQNWVQNNLRPKCKGRKHFSEFEQPLKTRISRSRSVFLFKFQQLSVFVILTAYTLAKDGWKHFQDTSTKVNYKVQLLLNKKWLQVLFFFQRFILKYVHVPRNMEAGGRLGRSPIELGNYIVILIQYGVIHCLRRRGFWTFLILSPHCRYFY